MADMANAVNQMALQFDPTPFLSQLPSLNPQLSPPQAPYRPNNELNWYDTFMANQQQGGAPAPTPAPQQPAAPAAGLGPQQFMALQGMMPKPIQWPAPGGAAARAPAQVQVNPLTLPQTPRTPVIPGFAGILGR